MFGGRNLDKRHSDSGRNLRCQGGIQSPAIAEITWIQALLQELHVPFSTHLSMWQSKCSGYSQPYFHSPTKSTEVDVVFVCHKVLSKQFQIYYIAFLDQWVDLLTKLLSPTRFVLIKDETQCDRHFSWTYTLALWTILVHIRIKNIKDILFSLNLSVTLEEYSSLVCYFQLSLFGLCVILLSRVATTVNALFVFNFTHDINNKFLHPFIFYLR